MKHQSKRLKIHRQTIRQLDTVQLHRAEGGMQFSNPVASCDSCTNCTCKPPA